MEPQIITFVVPSLSEQTITDQVTGTVTLYEDRLVHALSFYCRELDEKLDIWGDDVFRSYETMYLKKAVIGTSITRVHSKDRWKLTIIVQGADDLANYFEDEKECRDLATRVNDWLVSN